MPDTLLRLTCSREYALVARRGRRYATGNLILQGYVRPAVSFDAGATRFGTACSGSTRFGLTASRKVGGAVQRNRARRRMLAAAVAVLPKQSGYDLVLIARPGVIHCRFADLVSELERGLHRLGLFAADYESSPAIPTESGTGYLGNPDSNNLKRSPMKSVTDGNR